MELCQPDPKKMPATPAPAAPEKSTKEKLKDAIPAPIKMVVAGVPIPGIQAKIKPRFDNGEVTRGPTGDIPTREADWAGVKSEKVTNFGPHGPTDGSAVNAWTQAQNLRNEIDEQMSQLKAWDQTGQDLNHTPRIAVFAESGRRPSHQRRRYNSRTGTYRQENSEQITPEPLIWAWTKCAWPPTAR